MELFFQKRSSLVLITILLVAFGLRFMTSMNIGETYDEVAVAGYGKIYVGAIKNLDFSYDIWHINYEHPPIAKYLFGAAVSIERKLPVIQSAFDSVYHVDKRYFLAKVLSIILGIINIYLIYLIGKEWFNNTIGLASSFFLGFLPHFIAHNSIAGIETPQVLCSTILVYFYIKGIEKSNYNYTLVSYIFWGIFFLTKFSAIFFLPFYLLILVIYYNSIKKFRIFLVYNFCGLLLSVFTIYALWPWLWLSPSNLLTSFAFFKNSYSGEYFMGIIQAPPWYYYIVYLLATTPLAVIIFLAFIRVNVKGLDKKKILVVLIWLITPFFLSVLNLKKDGIRYIITAFPPLCLAAAIGYYIIISKLKTNAHKYILTIIVVFSIFYSIANFYPFYLDYYSSLVGGLQTVYKYRLLDYAWWGEGIKQAGGYINENCQNQSLFIRLKPAHVLPELNESIKILSEDDVFIKKYKPDCVVVSENYFYHNWQIIDLLDYNEVYRSSVNNLPLVRVYRKK